MSFLPSSPDTVRLSDLSLSDQYALADLHPEDIFPYRPELVAHARPVWVCTFRPNWAAANIPVILAENNAPWMAFNHPELLAQIDFGKLYQLNPCWCHEHRPEQSIVHVATCCGAWETSHAQYVHLLNAYPNPDAPTRVGVFKRSVLSAIPLIFLLFKGVTRHHLRDLVIPSSWIWRKSPPKDTSDQ